MISDEVGNAMKQCNACKESIDSKATKCPYCQTKQTRSFVVIFFAGVIVFVIYTIFSSTWDSTDSKKQSLNLAAHNSSNKQTSKAIDKAEAIFISYLEEYGQYPPTKHGQTLITTWKDIRDRQGNHLRYTLAEDGLFEIRSAGQDGVFDTYDDITNDESKNRRNRAEAQAQAEQQKGDSGFGFALGVAQGFVKDLLKSPSSAKWPGFFESAGHTRALGDNRYRIRSWVDSQNSFGALLRMNYTAIVRDNGNYNWSLESLTMDE